MKWCHRARAHDASPSPLWGAEGVGVRWGMPERSPMPASPSRACGAGPSLSPLKGGEGLSCRGERGGAGGAVDQRRFAAGDWVEAEHVARLVDRVDAAADVEVEHLR